MGSLIQAGYSMDPGTIHEVNSSIDLTFDTENYNFDFALLKLRAWVRDYDDLSANENAWTEISLIGKDIWGSKEIWLYSEDFTIKCNVVITKGNKGAK